jgi:leucine dehydrogenase
MLILNEYPFEGYEKVVEVIDSENGLHAIIAIHNTSLGPSLGGIRIYPYLSVDAALQDALRLSKGMTNKSTMAEIGLGGGKSVIIADPSKQKTKQLLTAFAQAVNMLEGKYICAADVGSTSEDMLCISKESPYVASLPTRGSSGDPSPFTARGVLRSMQTTAKRLWGSKNLEGRRIAIQGLGKVGSKLAEFLFWEGAELVICDIDEDLVQLTAHQYGCSVTSTDTIYKEHCDFFAPCALGGILNEETIPQLNCRAVIGGANNQLKSSENAIELHERGIIYAPDYVVNAGGIINIAVEFADGGYDPSITLEKIDAIASTLNDVYAYAESHSCTTEAAAAALVKHKLAHCIGQRKTAISFKNELARAPA